VLDRPIVIHAPDWEAYRDQRGVYFDLLAEGPGVVTRTDEELVDALESGRAWDESARASLSAFRARFCSLERGDASERLVALLWPDAAVPARVEPPSGSRAA
jgi:CDP-glycerol glycerophosphotransferase